MATLDPHVAGFLAYLAGLGSPPLIETTPQLGRAGFRALTVDYRDPRTVPPVADVADRTVPGPAGPLRVRIYRPAESPAAGASPVPTVVFYHGGGWVIGDLDTHDNQARSICRDTGAVVVSVDYRLAPEAPFPAAVDDAVAALAWAREHVTELGGDPARVAVAGDSAGGNLAAVAAQHTAREQDVPPLAGQLLVYPSVDPRGENDAYPSRQENGEGLFLTADDMAWFAAHYSGLPLGLFTGTGARDDVSLQHLADPRLSPIRGDVTGVAPAVVAVAGFDPLRDEGVAYAQKLRDAGVRVELLVFDSLVHGFFDLGPVSPAAADAVARTNKAFKGLLAG